MTRDELIAKMRGDGSGQPIKFEVAAWGTLYVRLPLVAEAENVGNVGDEKEFFAEVLKKAKELAPCADIKGDSAQLARSAARLLCTEGGDMQFNPDDADDVAFLAVRTWADLQKVLQAGQSRGN